MMTSPAARRSARAVIVDWVGSPAGTMTQTARGNDFERALNERHSELSDERLRLAELAKGIAAEQERGLILEQRIREIEAERDEAEERLANLDVSGGQNDELRRQISEVAAQIMKNGGNPSADSKPRENNRSREGKRRRSAGKQLPAS